LYTAKIFTGVWCRHQTASRRRTLLLGVRPQEPMRQGSPPRMKIVKLFSGASLRRIGLTTMPAHDTGQRSLRPFANGWAPSRQWRTAHSARGSPGRPQRLGWPADAAVQVSHTASVTGLPDTVGAGNAPQGPRGPTQTRCGTRQSGQCTGVDTAEVEHIQRLLKVVDAPGAQRACALAMRLAALWVRARVGPKGDVTASTTCAAPAERVEAQGGGHRTCRTSLVVHRP